MLREFEVHSAQFTHRGLRGTAREDVVRDFLVNYLPSNVDVVSGEIFDVNSSDSRESDVIALDRFKVPLMFSGSHRLVPIEGVYSVIEVKSNLTSAEMNDCMSKCTSLKAMVKQAYFAVDPTNAIVYDFNIYGRSLKHFPALFSVFAYRGVNPEGLLKQIEDYCRDKPPEKTIDSVICLDGWIICWWDQEENKFELCASPKSKLTILEHEVNSLLFFYLLYYKLISQATCDPINLIKYIQDTELMYQKYR